MQAYIDADSYLQEVTRYVHLNPIRMKGKADLFVKEKKRELERYSWSSYVYYVGRRKGDSFVAGEEILGYFGGNTARGRRNYRKFVEEGLEGEIESPLQRGKGHGIVGDEDFVEGVRDRFLKRVRESREIPGFKGIISQIAPAKILGLVC